VENLQRLLQAPLLIDAIAIAFIASAESLLRQRRWIGFTKGQGLILIGNWQRKALAT
jgi:hypothetical protein